MQPVEKPNCYLVRLNFFFKNQLKRPYGTRCRAVSDWLGAGVVICLGEVQICIWPSWYHYHSLSLAPVNPDCFYLFGSLLAHPGGLGQRAVKRVLLVLIRGVTVVSVEPLTACSHLWDLWRGSVVRWWPVCSLRPRWRQTLWSRTRGPRSGWARWRWSPAWVRPGWCAPSCRSRRPSFPRSSRGCDLRRLKEPMNEWKIIAKWQQITGQLEP